MPLAPATVERSGGTAVVRLHGEIAIPTVNALYGQLRGVCRRRDVRRIVVDFGDAARVDGAGIAVIEVVRRQVERAGKQLELTHLDDRQQAAYELLARAHEPGEPPEPPAGALERLGDHVIGVASAARGVVDLVASTVRRAAAVVARTQRLPRDAVLRQVAEMGLAGLFIVGLLSFLVGMTMGFQGAVQLQKFGAGPFVADMIGVSMVRELAPLMTAVIITGRTGAAIAAELGTMKVRSEIDALAAMGIDPVRFLVVPRLAAITFAGPALTLIGMFIGMLGGMLVAMTTVDMSVTAFWARLGERVDLIDFIHGFAKSVVFAWIIGLTGCYFGLRAGGDASSVGQATTRTVVTSIFFIILVDAAFATVTTLVRTA
jgi:phospholipid/cholesterol/gamma-HCH transport system permease protein